MMNTYSFKVLKGCNWVSLLGLHFNTRWRRQSLALSFLPIGSNQIPYLLRYLLRQNVVHMILGIEVVLFIFHQPLYPITVS
jgi:hypothetical protein